MVKMFFAGRKRKKKTAQRRRKKSKEKFRLILKFFKMINTFQIVQWEIAYCADDYTENAYQYWLNFFPLTAGHIRINFFDENYLVLIIRNKAWRMAYAFIK